MKGGGDVCDVVWTLQELEAELDERRARVRSLIIVRRTTSPTNEVDGIPPLDTSATTSRNASTWVDERKIPVERKISLNAIDCSAVSSTRSRTLLRIRTGASSACDDSATPSESVESHEIVVLIRSAAVCSVTSVLVSFSRLLVDQLLLSSPVVSLVSPVQISRR